MKELAIGKYVEQKSRFYTHLYDIDETSEIDQIIKSHRSQYKKVNHHCYAYVFITMNQDDIERFHDDGEVGHPGKILLELLKSNGFTHHLIVVSRVFGGIKLGVGGVSRAFKQAATATIHHYKSKR